METLATLFRTGLGTVLDVAPIVTVLVVFQVAVLRRQIPNLRQIALGFVYVLAGLTLFLVGLEEALFPIGETMALQLTAAAGAEPGAAVRWDDYLLVYAFAGAIGFATTVAEPSLIAVALKAEDVSGGTVGAQGLRIAVAAGVAVGVALGCVRIVTGTPLPWYIVGAYVVVIVQTFRSRRDIVPLAYDSGGVTTSTVTVPVLAALGLGLAASVPGRNVLIDGFGLIAFASVFPIMSVLGYAKAAAFINRRRSANADIEPWANRRRTPRSGNRSTGSGSPDAEPQANRRRRTNDPHQANDPRTHRSSPTGPARPRPDVEPRGNRRTLTALFNRRRGANAGRHRRH